MLEIWNIGIYERMLSILNLCGQDEFCYQIIAPLCQTHYSMIPEFQPSK
jgi:hypothetical protein